MTDLIFFFFSQRKSNHSLAGMEVKVFLRPDIMLPFPLSPCYFRDESKATYTVRGLNKNKRVRPRMKFPRYTMLSQDCLLLLTCSPFLPLCSHAVSLPSPPPHTHMFSPMLSFLRNSFWLPQQGLRSEVKWSRSVMSDSLWPHGL